MPRRGRRRSRGKRKFPARSPIYFFCGPEPPIRKTKRQVIQIKISGKTQYCTIGHDRNHWGAIYFVAHRGRRYSEVPRKRID